MEEVLVAVESSDPLVARLMAFCEELDVESKFAAFLHRHAETFQSASTDDEYGHEAHAIFQRYEELFEDVIAQFLQQEHLSPDAFFAHCRALRVSPKHENATDNLQLLLAALDFEAFRELMEQEATHTQDARQDAEDMGL